MLKCKRAKHRGSPKTLVTKVIKEILLPAWLITMGMVKSLVFNLEKLYNITDMWVIAVLSHPLKGVKEQRVDGSSISRSLDFVRCTLVAGKPVLGRKIYSDSNKSIIINNTIKRSMSSKLTLNPWFITGLVEAEGCFMLGFFKNDKYKMGFQIQAIFKITLHKKDHDLLSQVKDYFGVGTITNHGNTTLQYTVKSLKDLDTIISHFDKFPLLSQKWADYTLFKNAIILIKNKEHLNKEGLKKVISIRATMNLGLSEELKFIFPDIKPYSRPSLPKINNVDPNWIAGLASGDGCFHVSIRNSSTTKTGKSVVLKFHIVQHSRDIELMKVLITTLNCGKLELLLNQSAVYFVVTNFQDIFDKIIPLFDKYPIKGVKSLDFNDFKLIANLIHNKEHLTEEGLSKIQSLKLNMNLFRKL
uniref:homing endonuclease n=1 Tax=Leptographium procerum TaxID=100367 RepID=UPI0023F1CCD5|nr:homing endonuclease [Leptographium procerum]WDW21002.1 homing endonuclease [Leptographium procerum]WDZ67184.1 homing endonuclease [Leptographium procerum]